MDFSLICPVCANNIPYLRIDSFVKHCITEKHFQSNESVHLLGHNFKIDQLVTLYRIYDLNTKVEAYLSSDKNGCQRLSYHALVLKYRLIPSRHNSPPWETMLGNPESSTSVQAQRKQDAEFRNIEPDREPWITAPESPLIPNHSQFQTS
ncbi:hypothetical protein L873DRAFT_654630 [Choiromyces venosus 120613-1]|uniref:Uncharacterized protein n=1 Tax=Choiromyces venosus 120613-1 TaxID=1336337 RepID=A0A3N4JST9_9PEZI|nr:hypothetical protein L873DRAFT_654630 [Choiromyces venosus 120613-1]